MVKMDYKVNELHDEILKLIINWCKKNHVDADTVSLEIDGLNHSVECGLWHPGTDSSLAFFKDKKCVASSM